MKRVVYVISNIDRWISFEWIADYLRHECDLSFVLLNPGNSYFETFLQDRKVPFVRFNYYSKKDLPKTIFFMGQHFRELNPDIVHTHFLDANIAGLISSWLVRVPERIFTRHHSVFHHRYHKKGRIYDWLANLLATKIVAISKNVRDILIEKERVDASKIALIHHGFDLSLYQQADRQLIEKLRIKYNLVPDHFIYGVVSRYIHWKGIIYTINAFKQLRESNPDSFLLLMNARGPDKVDINEALKGLPEGSYLEVAFEKEMHAAYHLFDCFVHVPIDEQVEAFGQVYVEALAAGVPSIFTKSGIACDFVKDKENALVVNFKSSSDIHAAMLEVKNEPFLREKMIENGDQSIRQFNIDIFTLKLKQLYEI
jgi:glycosyltransferase involved in cell wall biosynthesis